jgi:hypothetical protein
MMDHEEQHHIKELLYTNQRRLRALELKQAWQGINTPAEVLMEIEDLRDSIVQCESLIETIDRQRAPSDNQNASKFPNHPTLTYKHIEITFKGDFSNLTPEIQAAVVRAIAAIVEIPSDEVEVLKIMAGSVIFLIKLPEKAAETLMKINTSKDQIIELLEIEKIRVIPTNELNLSLNKKIGSESESTVRVTRNTSKDRTVYRQSDGSWVNKRSDSGIISSIHASQKEAENAAREMLKNQGGGELTVEDTDGRIRSVNTVNPAIDLNPPKDKEP